MLSWSAICICKCTNRCTGECTGSESETTLPVERNPKLFLRFRVYFPTVSIMHTYIFFRLWFDKRLLYDYNNSIDIWSEYFDNPYDISVILMHVAFILRPHAHLSYVYYKYSYINIFLLLIYIYTYFFLIKIFIFL